MRIVSISATSSSELLKLDSESALPHRVAVCQFRCFIGVPGQIRDVVKGTVAMRRENEWEAHVPVSKLSALWAIGQTLNILVLYPRGI
jgi:hypothetical protein